MARAEPGLRELNRRRTREAISHAATRLFLARGFEKVTIADVAAAVGVAKMTVTNHFPRKEDLVLDLHEDVVLGPARAVAARAPGESALEALRRDCLAALRRRDAALGFSSRGFAALVTGSPALAARLREIHEQREDALAGVLAREAAGEGAHGPGHAALTARLAAVQLDGVRRVLFQEVQRRVLDGEDGAAVAEGLDRPARRAFDRLVPCLGDYAVRPGG